MTDEEYERIKQREKEHLRKMKTLREKARRLQRAKDTEQTASESVARAQALLDESSALARQLSEEAARSDARLDMASADADNASAGNASDDLGARARDLVGRLREEMDASAPGGDAFDAEDASPGVPEDDCPDKTIGPAT
jgi:hypothetical protein